ncbi:Lipoprotein-releasing system ATP-binding protein LolD [Planctomycetes bacterium Pan216]|uniref:Lipoprotein-releasing system ATP-binding protein LolD n=1 Tax=Kolteria novifilia TaxID=2527975 RepID=A0A518B6Z7_9BACT|nr:Lipoprotein-releasing system ATP-binding protein LolD [Planctomycetes bacterium Pan216]
MSAEPTGDPSETTRLLVERVSKTYQSATGTLSILEEVDLSLSGGDAVAIMGPSGSGKSTLLNMLGGLDTPTSGVIRVNDVEPASMGAAELARYRNRTVGFVFQDHHLLPQCSVLENVLIPTLAGEGSSAQTESVARDLLSRVGLANRLGHRPSQLSGGERQRVAIARALINRPALLLGDEPTGNLDAQTASEIADLLLELAEQHQAILIVVTHSSELAERLPRRFMLNAGRLDEVQAGSPA